MENDIHIKEDEKSVINRIGKLLTDNPGAVVGLLKKYDIQVEPATPGNIIAALTEKIVDDDEDFNYELAEILANPRFSGIIFTSLIITGITALISGGFGLAKAGIGRKAQQDAIEAQIRLTVIQQREAEKKRQAQLTLLVVGFALIIITAVAYFTFKPIKTS